MEPQNRGCMEITTMRLNTESRHVRHRKTGDGENALSERRTRTPFLLLSGINPSD